MGRYGCTQTTTNGDICVPPVPSTVKLVTEQDTWNSLRLGLTADLLLSERLKLTGEVAYDWISQRSQDTHYFTLGGDPASGHGSGFQAEGILSYQHHGCVHYRHRRPLVAFHGQLYRLCSSIRLTVTAASCRQVSSLAIRLALRCFPVVREMVDRNGDRDGTRLSLRL